VHIEPGKRPVLYVLTAIGMYFALSGVVTACACRVVTNFYHEDADIRLHRNAANHLRDNSVSHNKGDCNTQKQHSLGRMCEPV
jgi:hypothetical protein